MQNSSNRKEREEKNKKMKVLYKVSNAALLDTQFKPICSCMYH